MLFTVCSKMARMASGVTPPTVRNSCHNDYNTSVSLIWPIYCFLFFPLSWFRIDICNAMVINLNFSLNFSIFHIWRPTWGSNKLQIVLLTLNPFSIIIRFKKKVAIQQYMTWPYYEKFNFFIFPGLPQNPKPTRKMGFP